MRCSCRQCDVYRHHPSFITHGMCIALYRSFLRTYSFNALCKSKIATWYLSLYALQGRVEKPSSFIRNNSTITPTVRPSRFRKEVKVFLPVVTRLLRVLSKASRLDCASLTSCTPLLFFRFRLSSTLFFFLPFTSTHHNTSYHIISHHYALSV